jgi:hypothetical protein
VDARAVRVAVGDVLAGQHVRCCAPPGRPVRRCVPASAGFAGHAGRDVGVGWRRLHAQGHTHRALRTLGALAGLRSGAPSFGAVRRCVERCRARRGHLGVGRRRVDAPHVRRAAAPPSGCSGGVRSRTRAGCHLRWQVWCDDARRYVGMGRHDVDAGADLDPGARVRIDDLRSQARRDGARRRSEVECLCRGDLGAPRGSVDDDRAIAKSPRAGGDRV